MSQNQQNPFSVWTDMSKQMMDAWGAMASKSMPSSGGADGGNPFGTYYDFFAKSFSQNPFFASAPGNNIAEQFYKSWIDGMRNMSTFIPNPAIKDGFDRFMNSLQIFNVLQSYWDNFLKYVPADVKDWDSFSENVMQYYQDIAKGLSASFMPEQINKMFTMPMENFTAIQEALTHFFSPWVEESTLLQGYLVKALQGDKDAYKEFLDEWAKVSKDSLSKVLTMPALGANRASVEKMMKMLDDFVNFSTLQGELSSILSNMMVNAMERLIQHLAELYAEGKQPQTFLEFYSLWSRFNEQEFADMYSTDEFSKIMNETISAGSKLQILWDDFVQDMLAFLPIPNRRELDDVEMEVYKLRKTVKSLEKELKEVKGQLGKKPEEKK